MNITDQLKGHLWPTAESHELAERLLQIAGRNYPEADSVSLTIETDTRSLGELIRATRGVSIPPDEMQPYYRVHLRTSDRILITVRGPIMAQTVKWQEPA